jgi:DNA excision repair protein ERCC-3
MQYALAEPRERFRLASVNPRKAPVVRALLNRHRGRQALVLSTYVGQLRALAAELAPIVTGQTPHVERSELYDRFRSGDHPVLCVSKVANFALDLPSAGVAIEISGTFGSLVAELPAAA